MADRFPGHIKLGGTITIETVEERIMVEAALSAFAEWCSPSYGEPEFGDIPLADVAEHLNEEGYLHGKHDQARYGQFEEVEDACRMAGIGYIRHSSARYEYDAEIVEWRPGMESPFEQIADENGNTNVPGSTVETAITLIEEGRASEVAEMLKQALGQHVPALEPLVIIDNAPPEEE